MDHDLTTAPETGAPAAGGPEPGSSGSGSPASGRRVPPRPRSASGEGGGAADGTGPADGDRSGGSGPGDAGATAGGGAVSTVRLASPGSVVASIPLLFGFQPDNSLVVLGISRPTAGGRFIRHGVRIDLDQVRGRERAAALELAARLRDQDAEVAILVAFGPRGATGAEARPDHCRKLMAAFRAQIEAAPAEERVTVVDALYTCNGRWWSYMCRNTRCCPTTGTVVPAEAPPGLTAALTTRGHTVYPSREALDATLTPYPPEVLARTAAVAELLDPTWYDTDAGLADARRLMDALLLRCGDPDEGAPTAADSHDAERDAAASATASGRSTSAARIGRRGLTATVAVEGAARGRTSSADSAGGGTAADPSRRRTAAAESPRRGLGTTATIGTGMRQRTPNAASAIPAARSTRRVTDRVPASDEWSAPDGSAPLISDAEVAELLIALLNWRVRDYLACAAATEDSAGRLLRLSTELARRAPHPELRLAPYALAAWAAWAVGRPSVAQCAVDRALAIDPEYKFASLIRAGLHHAIDGEGVRESAASTRRDLFGEAVVDSDIPDPDTAPVPVPSQRSTETVPTDTDLEVS